MSTLEIKNRVWIAHLFWWTNCLRSKICCFFHTKNQIFRRMLKKRYPILLINSIKNSSRNAMRWLLDITNFGPTKIECSIWKWENHMRFARIVVVVSFMEMSENSYVHFRCGKLFFFCYWTLSYVNEFIAFRTCSQIFHKNPQFSKPLIFTAFFHSLALSLCLLSKSLQATSLKYSDIPLV